MIIITNIKKAHILHSEEIKKGKEIQLMRIIEKALLKRGYISKIEIK